MQIQSPTPDNIDAMSDLFAKTFGDFWTRANYLADGYVADSCYDWASSRIGTIDGDLATHFGVWDFAMRITSALVRVAGVGAVETSKSHRGRGLMSQTATDAIGGFRDAGYDLSLLFGIPNFYHRFGYVVTFPLYRFEIDARVVAPLESPVRFLPHDTNWMPEPDLYNADNAMVTGTFVRPTYGRNRRVRRWTGYSFDGGYLFAERVGDRLEIVDLAGPPEKVVDVARQLASQLITPIIRFAHVPPRSAMRRHLYSMDHRMIAEYEVNAGPMMKCVNLPQILEKMRPVINDRLQASLARTFTGTLALHGEDESVVMLITSGAVESIVPTSDTTTDGAVLAGPAVVNLLVGSDEPAEVCRRFGVETTGVARDLLPILFPNQEPSTIMWDRV